MKTQSMRDAGLHEKLRKAFRRATNPQEVISLGEKLGMEFSLEKAKEVAQRHQILLQYDPLNLEGRSTELSKTELEVHSKPEKMLCHYQIPPDFPGMVDGEYRPPYPEKKDPSESLESQES